jgi:putative pyruvate formate lyase activating enzyme
MPDLKFSNDDIAYKYLGVKNYYRIATEAIKEMHSQVGDLKVDSNNIAYRGLLIRHLVMPENLAGTDEIMHFIADEISINTYVNIMAQYFPQYKAYDIKELSRRITQNEYKDALKSAELAGLKNYKNSI